MNKVVGVELPLPPSANRMWRKYRGRIVCSKEYVSWLTIAVPLIRMTMNKFDNPISVKIVLVSGLGWSFACDLDNRIKPVLDAIRKAGRIVDDTCRYVVDVSISIRPNSRPREEAKVVVYCQEV